MGDEGVSQIRYGHKHEDERDMHVEMLMPNAKIADQKPDRHRQSDIIVCKHHVASRLKRSQLSHSAPTRPSDY